MDDEDGIKRERRDFADAQDEAAGRDNGKMRRFRPDDPDIDPKTGQKKDKDDEFTRAITAAALATAQRLRDLRDAANRDAWNRPVFRSVDGIHAFYEDGTELSGDEIAAVQWRPGAPAWEEYRAAYDDWQHAGSPALPSQIGSPEIPDPPPPGKSLGLKL